MNNLCWQFYLRAELATITAVLLNKFVNVIFVSLEDCDLEDTSLEI